MKPQQNTSNNRKKNIPHRDREGEREVERWG